MVEISESGLFLHVDRGLLILERKSEVIGKIPLDDIAVLMLTACGVTVTKQVFVSLNARGGVVMCCGSTYTPESIALPIAGHYAFSGRLEDQIEVSLPLKKQLWKSIVVEKIRNQALVLDSFGESVKAKQLRRNANRVLSGDSDNREAVAARIYWSALMGDSFTRDVDGEGLNILLNYGYAVLRGTVARAVCGAGLLPALGIFHKSKLNQMRLVDDLMEPYRPLVDCLVKQIGDCELTPSVKRKLVRVIWIKVVSENERSPLIIALETYVNSLVQSYAEKRNVLCIPKLNRKREKSTETEQISLLPI